MSACSGSLVISWMALYKSKRIKGNKKREMRKPKQRNVFFSRESQAEMKQEEEEKHIIELKNELFMRTNCVHNDVSTRRMEKMASVTKLEERKKRKKNEWKICNRNEEKANDQSAVAGEGSIVLNAFLFCRFNDFCSTFLSLERTKCIELRMCTRTRALNVTSNSFRF